MSTIDKSVEHFNLIMVCEKPAENISFEISEGYEIVHYHEQYRFAWINLHVKLGHFMDYDEGNKIFKNTFEAYPLDMLKYMYVTIDCNNNLVGTCALWCGNHFGYSRLRMHYLGVDEQHQKKGIARTMCLYCMRLYSELGLRDSLYLSTQTNSYMAIALYLSIGFMPYMKYIGIGNNKDEEEVLIKRAWDQVFEYIRKLENIKQ